MDNGNTSSLNVSLHAAEDLRRSIDSNTGLGSSTRTRVVDSPTNALAELSTSSGVSLWNSTDSNTWPRSVNTSFSYRFDKFRLSREGSGSCLLHSHTAGAEVCPFDSSKYRLPAYTRPSYSSSFTRRSSASYRYAGLSSEAKLRYALHESSFNSEVGNADESVDILKSDFFKDSDPSLFEKYGSNGSGDAFADTQLNADLWRPYASGYRNNVSTVDKMSSCKLEKIAFKRSATHTSHGNLASSSQRFPSRVSLKSSGSQENCCPSGHVNSNSNSNGGQHFNDNNHHNCNSSSHQFRMELEGKYEHYKDTYLSTSPEQELRTLNTVIVNIRKWLRKRHEALKGLNGPDSNKIIENEDVVKKLVAEAKKQQEGVDILLDRGQRFLSQRANIVLEVDLENLVFLWNSYVEGLRKLHAPHFAKQARDADVSSSPVKINSETGDTSNPHNLEATPVPSSPSEEENQDISESDKCNTFVANSSVVCHKEETSFEEKDRNSVSSSGSNSPCDLSQDISFGDSGSLTLEDLKTATTALEITDLTHNLPDTGDKGESDSADHCLPQGKGSEGEDSFDIENGPVSTDDLLEESSGDEENCMSAVDLNIEMASSVPTCTEKMEMEESEKSLKFVLESEKNDSHHAESSSPRKKVLPDQSTSPCFDKDTYGIIDGDTRSDVGSLITFDIPGVKLAEANGEDLPSEAKRRRMLLDPSVNTSNISSRSESPLSLDSSRSETPTGTLTRAERQNELWRAIGSIDTFLLDKDILEACESTASDLSCDDEDFVGAPNVSFAEFLQQYKELTDWLNQVHKVTQREVTSYSEKYLNQSYHEEMLERSPRREFLNNYSRQLSLRYPNMVSQISARMDRLNAQWTAVEEAIMPKHGKHDADTMLQDLECDLNTLRRWLNMIEARLLPLTIKADWTDAELEERLQQHKVLQRDIESHNKIVNAVLKLSERLECDSQACGTDKDRDSLQLVALNLERRWHGIWLQSLEWQCRLEEAISRRKGVYQSGFDFSGFSLPVLDESLFSQSGHDISDQGLIELEDDSLLFIGHREYIEDSSASTEDEYRSFELSRNHQGSEFSSSAFSEPLDIRPQDGLTDISPCGSLSNSGNKTPTEPRSPTRPSAFSKPESPLGKRPFPGFVGGEASPAKRGSQSPSSSSGGLSPVVQGSPVESFITSRGLHINKKGGLLVNSLQEEDDHTNLRVRKSFCDRSSGDSANISETESKMGDSPPSNNHLSDSPHGSGRYVITSSDGENDLPLLRNNSKSEVKDIGYSSESQSNDEVEIMRHQIDMEYKYAGKCEVASDGPLGDKVTLPSLAVRTDYYCMTLVDVDSTDKTDNGDTTDSGAEKVKEKERGKADKVADCISSPDLNKPKEVPQTNHFPDSDSLEDSWDRNHFPSSSSSSGRKDLWEEDHIHGITDQSCLRDEDTGMIPMYQQFDFSESDSAPESKEKKSIQYLIDHAEDLVRPPSPKHSCPSSPSKQQQQATQTQSPSKQTQTDSCSTVESSCDASGEDNSEVEGQKTGNLAEDFSTATDDADETLFNSVINLDSATESARNASAEDMTFTSPSASPVYDSPRLRKQTGRSSQQQGKKDRPWSVVGLQDVTTSSKRNDNLQETVAASESAIDYLHFHTDNDSSSPFLNLSQSSTFPRENQHTTFRRAFSSSDQTSTPKSAKRKLKYSAAQVTTGSTVASTTTSNSGVQHEDVQASEGSSNTMNTLPNVAVIAKLPYSDTSSGEKSPRKNRRTRRLRRRSSLEKKEGTLTSSAVGKSSATESYDSAEAESESETTDEYLTAPMEAATSDGDDVHNVSGSMSENGTWDNYHVLYSTVSEDQGEELIKWEPQDDDLEYDDDFQLSKQARSIVTDVMTGAQQRSKLKFTKHGVPADDSDSDMEDFHHILDQSELALRMADQSLRKKRKNPMGTGLHPKPAKYDEIIETYKTSIRCLETICQHLKSEDVSEQDVKRVQDLMYQWEKLYALASERYSQALTLSSIKDSMDVMKIHVQEAGDCLPFDRFSSEEELKETIIVLKDKMCILEKQAEQLEEIQKQLKDFSVRYPTINIDKYYEEWNSVQKSTAFMASKVHEHVGHLENNRAVWLEYLDSQRELDILLAADRERLHNLLCQRENGMRVTKKDVLRELETLQSNLSVYESKLSILQAMWARLTRTSDHSAQRLLLASLADLRNQLLVVTERCRQIYRDVEEDEDIPLDHHPDLGKLAVSAAALHEVFKKPRNEKSATPSLANLSSTTHEPSGITRSCASWLRSLPVQVVALMLVAGLVYALDPEILDRLSNFTITITPELRYVNGPPTI